LSSVFSTLAQSLAAGLKFIAFRFHNDLQTVQPENMAAEQRKLLGKNIDEVSLLERKLRDASNSRLSPLEKSYQC
jgi:hypothetical protein